VQRIPTFSRDFIDQLKRQIYVDIRL